MRNYKNLSILFILCLSLLLRADACTEEEEIDLVFGADFVATLQSSEGFTEASDEDQVTLDADDDVLEAIDDIGLEGEVESIVINGASFRMVANDGHDARRSGEVFVTINGGAELKLMDWNTPNNLPGTEGFASANPIDPATAGIRFDPVGLGAVNTALETFLANYNGGIQPNPLKVVVRATWDSTPPPSASDPDDFQWEARLLFQVKQSTLVDKPSI